MGLFKRELKNLSHSLFAWLYTGCFLLVAGIFFTYFNWLSGNASLVYVYNFLLVYSLAALPIFTVFAIGSDFTKERKLFFSSLPIGKLSPALAKYFATLLWILLPTAVTALFPLLLKEYGGMNFGSVYLSFLGFALSQTALLSVFFFLGALLLKTVDGKNLTIAYVVLYEVAAVTFRASSIADLCAGSRWIGFAFVLGLCVNIGIIVWRKNKIFKILLAVLGGISLVALAFAFLCPIVLTKLLPDFLALISVAVQFRGFGFGFFPIFGCFYLLFLTVGFAFLAKIVYTDAPKKERWIALGCALLLLAVYLASAFVPLNRKSFGKISETFSLTEDGVTALQGLQTDVTLYYICNGGERNADSDLYRFALQFSSVSDKVRVRVIDPLTNETFMKENEALELTDQNFLVVCGSEKQKLASTDLYFYYNAAFQTVFTPEEYNYYVNLFTEAGDAGATYLEYLLQYSYVFFSGESSVLSAMSTVSGQTLITEETLLSHASDKLMETDYLNELPSGKFVPIFWAAILPLVLLIYGFATFFSRKRK